jgi:chaperonin GroES
VGWIIKKSATFNAQIKKSKQTGDTKMKVRPLADRVLVEILEAEEKTKGGIILPDSAKQEKSEGKVIAVGTGKTLESGKVQAIEVKKGDRVIFGKYSGDDIEIDDVKHKILKESEILAVYEKE